MPANVERLDDRTFFILYALTKSKTLNLPSLRCLYDIEKLDNSQKVFKELVLLQNNFKISINFTFAPVNQNIEKAQRIYESLNNYREIIEHLNTDISYINKINFNNPITLYLADVVGCTFSIPERNYARFKRQFELYYGKQNPRKRIYNLSEHRDVIIKYFKSSDGKCLLPNPKIKLSRITNKIADYKDYQTRYNFWHTFKELENKELIKVNNILIDENEPTVDFTVPDIRKFIRKSIKEDSIIRSIEQFDIYMNKIVNRNNGISADIPTKSVRDLIIYALENPSSLNLTSFSNIKRNCPKVNPNSFSTIKNLVNKAIQTVLNDNEFKLIGNKTRFENTYKIYPLNTSEQDI